MHCTIARKVEHEFVSFKYNGEVKNKIELPADEKNSEWVGGFENYTLKETDGITTLEVEMTVTDAMLDYFSKTFPVALENVKKLSEFKIQITVESVVNAPVEKVWDYWSKPEHIAGGAILHPIGMYLKQKMICRLVGSSLQEWKLRMVVLVLILPVCMMK